MILVTFISTLLMPCIVYGTTLLPGSFSAQPEHIRVCWSLPRYYCYNIAYSDHSQGFTVVRMRKWALSFNGSLLYGADKIIVQFVILAL